MLGSLQLFATAAKIELSPLRHEHKKAIFAFHAGRLNEHLPSHWCEPFSTAFDLRIAGQCQNDDAVAETRAQLYESYIRSAVPSVSSRSVLRKLACHMGENFRPVLALSDYERIVEKFVQELGLPLSIADELLKSRLLSVDREVVTFEHELLRDYFRAEHLLRETALDHLAAKLEKPKYTGLTEFIIPSLASESLVRELLLARPDADLFNKAFRGWLGSIAMRIIRDPCQRLLTECRDRLSDITVEPFIGEFDDGRRFVSSASVVGTTCASDLDKKLCAVIADNLGDHWLQGAFLELLDLGEWALKAASERIGRELRIKPSAIWGMLLHHNVTASHNGPVHVLLFLCNQVCKNRTLDARRLDGSLVREALLKKAREGTAGALALLLLLFNTRFSESIDVADVVAIARQAWDTGLQTIRHEALNFLRLNAHAICKAGHRAEEAVIALLDTFDVKSDIFLSTAWLETRSSFGGLETGTDRDTASQEFRNILAVAAAGDDPIYQVARETDPSVTFIQFVAKWASEMLGRIFEDVFQGVYNEAFESLTADEKRKLLTLALQKPGIGFFTDWYLKLLCNLGCQGAEDSG